MNSEALNQTMNSFTITQQPIVDPMLAYIAIGAIILVVICCGYIGIKRPFRKKSKTKHD